MTSVATYQLNDTNRVVVEVDEYGDNECPVEWVVGGFVPLREPSRSALRVIDPLGTADEVKSFFRNFGEDHSAVVRHYARRGYKAEVVSLQGFTQGDWADVVVYVPNEHGEYIDGTIQSVRDWFEGSIYVLEHQTLETYIHATTLEKKFEWETKDSLCGVYIDAYDEQEVLEYAQDNFGIKVEEVA